MAGMRLMAILLATTALAQSSAAPKFVDVTSASGVAFRHQASKTTEKYLPESMGAGVALIDYDNDGLLDIFFVNGASLGTDRFDKSDPKYWNRLYRNDGGFKFTDVTGKAGLRGTGYGMGAATGDFDRDGRTDLYVTTLSGNLLYRNQGDGTFRDVTASSGTVLSGWSTGAAFLDYDNDGYLDLFVARYLDWDFSKNEWCGARQPGHRSYCHPDRFAPVTHVLLRNNGDRTFTDVSAKTGIAGKPGKGLGVALNDYNRDGRTDIFVANDSYPQQLFRNSPEGKFEEVALDLGLAFDDDGKTFAGMGADFRDYDNDGLPDIFVNALAQQRYALFRNTGKAFDYHSGPSRLGQITRLNSGWGAALVDFDNDGWRDLFVAQGHVMDNIQLTQPALRYLEPPLLLRNVRGVFENVSKISGGIFTQALAARGAALGDLDNDGSVDIVLQVNDGEARILRNTGHENHHWLVVDTNAAIGASVSVVTVGGTQHGFVTTAGSYLSASDPRLHFGLGGHGNAREIEIRWPSGRVMKLENVQANRFVKIKDATIATFPER